ncbi:tripartite tricarboxylate transporter TctB family protein [Rhodobacteraceae bacterium D3-12]|nr:tripartite tricarboxylate transporter TctB family protein [Rhodobacteraceae bacterium D3-12]
MANKVRLTCHSVLHLRIGLFFSLLAVLVFVAINDQFGPLGKDATIVPMIGAGAMFVLGVCLAGSAFKEPNTDVEAEEPLSHLSGAEMSRFIAAFAVVALHAWLLPWLGVLIGGVTLQFLLYLLLGVPLLRGLLISVASVAVLYVFIGLLLGVQLPLGLLE